MGLATKRNAASTTITALNIDVALINKIRHRKSVFSERSDEKRRVCSNPLGFENYVYKLAAVALAELDLASSGGEQGVVAATAHVVAWVKLGAALANQNRPGGDCATVEYLYAEALCV